MPSLEVSRLFQKLAKSANEEYEAEVAANKQEPVPKPTKPSKEQVEADELKKIAKLDRVNPASKKNLAGLLRGKVQNERERKELESLRKRDLVNPSSRRNISNLLAKKNNAGSFFSRREKEERKELDTLTKADAVNDQTRANLAAKLQRKTRNTADKGEHLKELAGVKNLDCVNPNSKANLAAKLALRSPGKSPYDRLVHKRASSAGSKSSSFGIGEGAEKPTKSGIKHADCKLVFDEIKTPGSNFLTFTQFKTACDKLGLNYNSYERGFRELDKNCNGRLEYVEFMKVLIFHKRQLPDE